ncbi:gag-aspartyl protease domain-containing protein [Tanacetum coccineum]
MMAEMEEGPCEGEDAHMGSLRVLNAINARKESPVVRAENKVRVKSRKIEAKRNKNKREPKVETKGKLRTKSKAEANGLRFVSTIVNKISTRALVDTGATHNFISVDEAKRLGLEMTKDSRWIKFVNGDAKAISGVARDGGLVCMVAMERGTKSGAKMMSAIQLEGSFKGLKHNTGDISSDVETSRDTKDVLEDLNGAISSVLPKRHVQESFCKGRRRTRRRQRVTKHEQGSTMEEAKGESTLRTKACHGRDPVMLKRIHDEDVASLGRGGCHDPHGLLGRSRALGSPKKLLEDLDAS